MECVFCKKTFSTKGNLFSHQKTAKYCLNLQGKNLESLFTCEYCNKDFTQRTSLSDHISICKDRERKIQEEKETQHATVIKKLEAEISKLKRVERENIKKVIIEKDSEISRINQIVSDQKEKVSEQKETIRKLETKLEKFENIILESKTEKKSIQPITNNTTNIVINALNLNDIEKMTSFLEEKLDKNVLAGGQKGLAKLLSETILKNKYKCVDPSRQNFEFTNELGELERDVKAKKLTNALIKGDICSKSADKGIELWKKEDGSTDPLSRQAHSANVFDMINFDRDNSTFRSELTALTS